MAAFIIAIEESIAKFFGDRFFSVLHLMKIGVKYSSIKFNFFQQMSFVPKA